MSTPYNPNQPGGQPMGGQGQGQPYGGGQGGYPGGQPQQPTPPGYGQQPGGYPPPGGGAPPPGGPGGPAGPGGPGGWQGGASFAGEPEPKRSSRTPIVVALAVVLVLAAAAGAYAVTRFMGSSGAQPADALPDTAVGYFRVDLNPSGDQKLKMYNFFSKFPAIKDKLGAKDEDPRKWLFDLAQKEAGSENCMKSFTYEKDFEPWMGSRLGVAVVPGSDGKEPDPVGALEVKDEKAAKAAFDKINAECDKNAKKKTGIAFSNGYAILAEDQGLADQFSKAAQDKPLSKSELFSSAMDKVGDQGIMSFWADGDELTKMMAKDAGSDAMGMSSMFNVKQGRMAGALKFDDRYVELVGYQIGGPKVPAGAKAGKLGELPNTTAGAVSIGGAGAMFKNAWTEYGLEKMMGSQKATFEAQLGIKIPGDVTTLLGDDLTVAVDKNGLDKLGSGGMGSIGARFTTDPAKAKPTLQKLLDAAKQAAGASGGMPPLYQASGSGALSVATSQDYAQKLVGGGDLASSESFKLAVPDSSKAQVGVFVDLDSVEKFYLPSMDSKEKANIQPLQAVGISGSADGDDAKFSARLVVN